MFSLNNQTALVTGASGGIGGAIARSLHQHGATVALSGTRREALEVLANELGERVYVIPCNLSNTEDVEKLIPSAEEQMGKLDILVNNAGITRDGLAMRMKDEDWQMVIDVNLSSVFRLSRAAIKGMMKRRFGRIINITSIVGVTGNAGQINYSAAKAGLIGLSKSLALEVATRGITVNCIAPGYIVSSMTDGLPDSLKEKMNSTIPMGRAGQPEEISAAVVFFASQSAAYITGQTLHINGGMAMI